MKGAAAVLEGRDLTCRYDGAEVLTGASLSLPAGELLAVCGPSGSGKTSLLNIFCGFAHPDGGEVTVDGMAVDPAELSWSTLAIIPQALGLLAELTVAENVALPARLAGGQPGARTISELLGELDLARLGDRLSGQLSVGESQRVAVARALALDSRIVLADEPTSHQDERRAALVLKLLQERCRRGAACLVATHDPAVLAAASTVLVLENGRLGPDDRRL